MGHFEFEYPLAFLLLALIVCIYKCPLSVKKLIFPHTHLFHIQPHWFNKEKLLYSLILALMVTALASPITFDSKGTQHRKGRDLVFALDTSGSMNESGYDGEKKEKSKFTILKETIESFISHRFDDNVGVVVFGSFAFSAVPITYDMHSLSFMLDYLQVGMAGTSTAIGDALDQSLRMLQKSDAKNKVIVLVTDGKQNSGRVKIADAVAKAKKTGVKVYTVGIGEKGSYDAAVLEKIAKDTDAKSFSAEDAKTLQKVYAELDALEPSHIRSKHYLNKHPLYIFPLAGAIVLLLYLLAKRGEYHDAA